MSLKPQFTQGLSELRLLRFCSMQAAVLALLVVNAVIGSVALMSAASMAHALSTLYAYAFWINPAVLVALAIVCAIQRRRHEQASAQSVAPELEEANLQHLGAAIRPHFFFNALNAVMGLIRVNPKQAEAVLQDTAELFRSVMQQHEQRLVTLATELDTCQQYARIEQARLAQRLVLEWHIDDALLAVSVPPFSLQPLIENAIRHGIEPLAKGGKVTISVQRHEQQLVMRVTNPVVSELERYSATKAAQHNGIALDNIAQRLALMYDQAAQFEHGVVEGHYEAHLALPLEFEA
jgi:two-component system, LytTR family, sensor histidine kinase AlgZ